MGVGLSSPVLTMHRYVEMLFSLNDAKQQREEAFAIRDNFLSTW